MAKINNDKYYTPIETANYCWDRTFHVVGEENISEIIEPGVGDGSFLHHSRYFPRFAYDIEPECESNGFTTVIKGDFLEQDIEYLDGRLLIGNPPYGRCMNMAQKFYRKGVEIADTIAFILPISQLNNTHSLYEFDLVHSEDLGVRRYSDRKLHCCFNIYRRPHNGKTNTRHVSKLKDITIHRQDCRNYESEDFDLRMCYWGNGTVGKMLKDNEHYAGEYKIKINNPDRKAEITRVLTEFNWKEYLDCIAMKRLKQYHIIEILKENIPDIE